MRIVKKEDLLKGIEYSENEKEFLIEYLTLERKESLELYNKLIDFVEKLKATHFKAEFFLFEKGFQTVLKLNTAHSRILKKSNLTHVGNDKTGLLTGYELNYEFNKEFLRWFLKEVYIFPAPSEIHFFNKKNERITEFTNEPVIIFYNLEKNKIKELKQQLKHLEDNPNYWKKIVIRLNKGKDWLSIPSKIVDYYLVDDYRTKGNVMLFTKDVIIGKEIRNTIKRFNFKHFDKMYQHLYNQKTKYKKIWKPEEIKRIFEELETKIKKNNKKLPIYYYIRTLSEYKQKKHWMKHNKITLQIENSIWNFEASKNKIIAKDSQGNLIDLTKPNKQFKLNKTYKAKEASEQYAFPIFSVEKFKTETKSFYEQHKPIFKKIKQICKYAAKKEYKISMTIGKW